MQINNINSKSFGAIPTTTTRYLLRGLEQKGVDTMPILLKMKKIFTNETIDTRRFSDGTFYMNMYCSADKTRQLLKPCKALHLDKNYYPIEAEKLTEKLLKRLDKIDKNRGQRQRIIDKIDGVFPLPSRPF